MRVCKGLAVGEVFVAVKLGNINESLGKELPGQGGIGIDEDAHPEDVICESGQERGGKPGRAVALALVPEVYPEGIYPELGEALRVAGGGDSADLERRDDRVEEAVEEFRHRPD